MRGRYDMPEGMLPAWVLWVLFMVVLLPVAAFCLAMLYALVLSAHLGSKKRRNRRHAIRLSEKGARF